MHSDHEKALKTRIQYNRLVQDEMLRIKDVLMKKRGRSFYEWLCLGVKGGWAMRADRRSRLAEIFQDTLQFCGTDRLLAEAIEKTRKSTVLYDEGKAPSFPKEKAKAGIVSVTKSRTFEAAIRLSRENPGKRIAVLNFASATNPGGGVVNGSSAQEECLCRCSTLYPTLNRSVLWEGYYNVNRAAGNVLHTDACIYTPGIVICKTDTDYPG